MSWKETARKRSKRNEKAVSKIFLKKNNFCSKQGNVGWERTILLQEDLVYFKPNERSYTKHVQLFTCVSWCVCVWTLEGEVLPWIAHLLFRISLLAHFQSSYFIPGIQNFSLHIYFLCDVYRPTAVGPQTGTTWWFADDGPRRVCAAALCSLEGAAGVPSTSRTLWKVWICIYYLLCVIHNVIVY